MDQKASRSASPLGGFEDMTVEFPGELAGKLAYYHWHGKPCVLAVNQEGEWD